VYQIDGSHGSFLDWGEVAAKSLCAATDPGHLLITPFAELHF